MKLDIIAIAAHPDDAELSCSGTLIKAKKAGKNVGIIDLTRGELGSRGTAKTRAKEAAKSAEIMGLDVRVNLDLGDGFFENNKISQLLIIEQLRKFRPDTVLINAVSDRHPDHGRGGALGKEACFLSGLVKIETSLDGKSQENWRPRLVHHYIQDYYIRPDIVVDISEEVAQKIEAIRAFETQFYDPDNKEPKTAISRKDFLDFLKGRWADHGRYIGVEYGEGYMLTRPIGVEDITKLI